MNDMGVEIDTKSGLRNRWTHRRLEMVPDWANDYQKFEAWCKSHGWQEGSPIKRIRYDELMGPDNCRIIDGIDTYAATPGYSNRPCLQCQRGTDECCTVVHMSDLERPELMKDFRISATWTHCGIVFHSPWGIFQELVNDGSIQRVSKEAEAEFEKLQ